MSDTQFCALVEEGINTLPEWVQRELSNVIFLIEDEPNELQCAEHELGPDDTLFGLYEGVPLTERGIESPLMPDIITVFKKPILETYKREEDIRECILNTIWHEVAHYFGHDEEWVTEEEVRRGKIK
jgi:predicted Zn-dependent protease with MMP-like domain